MLPTSRFPVRSSHELYLAALTESDRAQLPTRIAEAERALLLRSLELSRIAGDHIEEECFIDDAIYALRALRNVDQYVAGSGKQT